MSDHPRLYAAALRYSRDDTEAWFRRIVEANRDRDHGVHRIWADWLEDRGHPLHSLVRADADRRDEREGMDGEALARKARAATHGLSSLGQQYATTDPLLGRVVTTVTPFIHGSHCRVTAAVTHPDAADTNRMVRLEGVLPREAAAAWIDHVHETGGTATGGPLGAGPKTPPDEYAAFLRGQTGE